MSQVTGCANRAFVQQLLLDNWGDVNACIDFIYMVGAHDVQFQKEYLSEKKEGEKKESVSEKKDAPHKTGASYAFMLFVFLPPLTFDFRDLILL